MVFVVVVCSKYHMHCTSPSFYAISRHSTRGYLKKNKHHVVFRPLAMCGVKISPEDSSVQTMVSVGAPWWGSYTLPAVRTASLTAAAGRR